MCSILTASQAIRVGGLVPNFSNRRSRSDSVRLTARSSRQQWRRDSPGVVRPSQLRSRIDIRQSELHPIQHTLHHQHVHASRKIGSAPPHRQKIKEPDPRLSIRRQHGCCFFQIGLKSSSLVCNRSTLSPLDCWLALFLDRDFCLRHFGPLFAPLDLRPNSNGQEKMYRFQNFAK